MEDEYYEICPQCELIVPAGELRYHDGICLICTNTNSIEGEDAND